jgi:hypothetical protein
VWWTWVLIAEPARVELLSAVVAICEVVFAFDFQANTKLLLRTCQPNGGAVHAIDAAARLVAAMVETRCQNNATSERKIYWLSIKRQFGSFFWLDRWDSSYSEGGQRRESVSLSYPLKHQHNISQRLCRLGMSGSQHISHGSRLMQLDVWEMEPSESDCNSVDLELKYNSPPTEVIKTSLFAV